MVLAVLRALSVHMELCLGRLVQMRLHRLKTLRLAATTTNPRPRGSNSNGLGSGLETLSDLEVGLGEIESLYS